MAADICAETIMSGASAWYHGAITGHSSAKILPSSHESFEAAAPPPLPPLSRCSSTSSLTSMYSTCSNDSSSTTDSSSPDESCTIIGILKKSKPARRRVFSSKQHRNASQDSSPSSSPSGTQEGKSNSCSGNESYHEEEPIDVQEGEGGDYSWEDDDDDDQSECGIVFERHVTFSEPLATDLVSGVPVAPSPHSRTEWTARRARECLERMRKIDAQGFLDCKGADGEQQDNRRVQDEKEEDGDGDEEQGESDGEEADDVLPLQPMREHQTKSRDADAGNDPVSRVPDSFSGHI